MKSFKQQQKKRQLIDYFKIVESNILYTFRKIKKEYERDETFF
ncbi:Biotin--protein ligase [Rickettsia prowazekii str. Cairo 3]|nr:Biotin--protein ligase [Rickettsia prowazekii str. Cairo 3]